MDPQWVTHSPKMCCACEAQLQGRYKLPEADLRPIRGSPAWRNQSTLRQRMGFADPMGKRPSSGGWWRLLAGIVGVLAATLGFGFYLPLRQGNQLLTAEYTQARQANVSLEQELHATKMALTTALSERDALQMLKTSHDETLAAHKRRVSQVIESLPPAVQAAVSGSKLKLGETPSALYVEVLEPTLFTARGDALTKTGRSLLCQIISQAQRQGLTKVAVRTFAPPVRSNPTESRWANAERLATGVADLLGPKCAIPADQLSIGSALEVPGGARLRLEIAAAGN